MALARLGDVVDGADVERNELLRVDWHQDGEILLVDEELALLESLWESFYGRVGLNESHLLLLLLFLGSLDFSMLESCLELLKPLVEES